MTFAEAYVPETREEVLFFSCHPRYGAADHAAIFERKMKLRETLANNIVAQRDAPDGVYAVRFDERGWWHFTPAARWYDDEEPERIRIRAATRKV